MGASTHNEGSAELSLWLRDVMAPFLIIQTPELLRLKNLIEIYAITNRQALLANASRLAPVIVKSAHEQDLFQQIISKAVIELKDEGQTPQTATKLNENPLPEKPEKPRKKKVVFYVLLSIGALLIVAAAAWFLHQNAQPVKPPKPNPKPQPVTASTVKTITLPQVTPLTVPPKTNPGHGQIFGILFSLPVSAIIIYLIALAANNRHEKKISALRDKYNFSGKIGWPHAFIWPNLYEKVFFNNSLENSLSVLSTKKSSVFQKIDFPNTIYNTIRNAGFLKLAFTSVNFTTDYIFLIATNLGDGQQSECLDLFPDFFLKRGLSAVTYYYKGSAGYVSTQKDMADAISFQQLREKFPGAFLVILGDGYGFIDNYVPNTNNPVALAPANEPVLKQLAQWDKKVLFSVVPRANWSSFEKTLFDFTPIFPATEEGFNFFIKTADVLRNKRPLFPRDPAAQYQTFPVESSLNEYKVFFEDEGMVQWLCCLALSDQQSLSITIAIGKELESRFFQSKKLVTAFNLVKITSVKWLNTGTISTNHRNELIAYLRQTANGPEMIKATSDAMTRLLLYVNVEKGSLLDMDREIKLAVYRQWKEEESLLETAYLRQQNLLDSFSNNQFKAQGKIRPLSFFKQNAVKLTLGGILLACTTFFCLTNIGSTSRWLTRMSSSSQSIDSFAYYNNAAVALLQKYQNQLTPGNVNEVNQLLDKAGKIDPNNAVYKFNKRAVTYLEASYYYNLNNQKSYDTAARLFISEYQNNVTDLDSLTTFSYYGQSASLYQLHQLDSACSVYTAYKVVSESLKKQSKQLLSFFSPCQGPSLNTNNLLTPGKPASNTSKKPATSTNLKFLTRYTVSPPYIKPGIQTTISIYVTYANNNKSVKNAQVSIDSKNTGIFSPSSAGYTDSNGRFVRTFITSAPILYAYILTYTVKLNKATSSGVIIIPSFADTINKVNPANSKIVKTPTSVPTDTSGKYANNTNSNTGLKLLLIRKTRTANSTIGELSVNGSFFCYTLEPMDRGLNANMSVKQIQAIKVEDKTAIPTGSYPIISYDSPKQGRIVPLLANVPGFADIEIHMGNYSRDTDGAILLGSTYSTDFVGNSTAITPKLYKIIFDALNKGETVTITIE